MGRTGWTAVVDGRIESRSCGCLRAIDLPLLQIVQPLGSAFIRYAGAIKDRSIHVFCRSWPDEQIAPPIAAIETRIIICIQKECPLHRAYLIHADGSVSLSTRADDKRGGVDPHGNNGSVGRSAVKKCAHRMAGRAAGGYHDKVWCFSYYNLTGCQGRKADRWGQIRKMMPLCEGHIVP